MSHPGGVADMPCPLIYAIAAEIHLHSARRFPYAGPRTTHPSIDPNTDGGNEPGPMPFPHPPEGDAEVLPFFTTETRKP
ncbi:hypothetical protein AGR7C_Lc140262 [Agrobacterium deltaense Zutra 3/1]|uniref:Uncharacterized protein n=1 Tax=Agrobacterium deltaense Zutra 3/1 TaxID=1183427 RepID=A0A1S7RD77_9HYPH|nr:hypothetical protein AGR7C_Lc140262 [Agrobacterium deltaense Zutra 3/1]